MSEADVSSHLSPHPFSLEQSVAQDEPNFPVRLGWRPRWHQGSSVRLRKGSAGSWKFRWRVPQLRGADGSFTTDLDLFHLIGTIYDALILAAALEADCDVLYAEDMRYREERMHQ
jgi:hypothetical protein